MRNVWIVVRDFRYDGQSIEKVFGTRRAAVRYAQKEGRKIDNHYENMQVIRKRVIWSN